MTTTYVARRVARSAAGPLWAVVNRATGAMITIPTTDPHKAARQAADINRREDETK